LSEDVSHERLIKHPDTAILDEGASIAHSLLEPFIRGGGWMSTESEGRIETWFVVPIVRNSNRQAHIAELWSHLRREIYDIAGGFSGPKQVIIEDIESVAGSWRDPATGAEVPDESRKYTVVIAQSRVGALREVLERAANSFDQEEILFMVKGEEQSVRRDPSKGFLHGDPSAG
jgi:hypothetical protein